MSTDIDALKNPLGNSFIGFVLINSDCISILPLLFNISG